MNPIINNLSLIADAAEYFDRSTSAAWRIRAKLTNLLVWQASSLLYAETTGDGQRIHAERVKLATMRCWMRDCNASSFVLDLTQPSIRRTLGLDREVDTHAEACRVARAKCLQARSAARFKEFYDKALLQLEERRAQREARVSSIEDLLSGHGFVLDGQVFDSRGYDTMYEEEFVSDEALYDDDTVALELDGLAETLGNALESMWAECDAQLAGSIIANKIARLTGYKTAIEAMMKVVGVDTQALAKRQVRLEQLIAEQADAVGASVADIDAQIAQQMSSITVDQFCDTLAANRPTARQLQGGPEYQARKAAETAAARAREEEDKQLAATAAKRSAAARKAAETRKARRMADIGTLVTQP